MKRAFLVLFILFAAGQACFAQVRYTIQALGIDSLGLPVNINQSGQVVGTDNTFIQQAEYWNGSSLADLGSLGVPPNAGSQATGINNSGQIVGQSSASGSNSGFTTTAVIWQNGSVSNLNIPSDESFAADINDAGDITGWYFDPADSKTHAFVQQAGVFQDIGTLNRSSRAIAINSSGTVVGWTATQSPNEEHAFAWSNGVMTDLGAAPGAVVSNGNIESLANDINDLGQIVGYSTTANGDHPILWENGSLIDLGLPSGATYAVANGINNHGIIVGNGDAIPGYSSAALIWENGQVDLLDNLVNNLNSNWQFLRYASAINDAGQIAGVGIDNNGFNEAFLLTPVPEPSGLILTLVGVFCLVIWHLQPSIATDNRFR